MIIKIKISQTNRVPVNLINWVRKFENKVIENIWNVLKSVLEKSRHHKGWSKKLKCLEHG